MLYKPLWLNVIIELRRSYYHLTSLLAHRSVFYFDTICNMFVTAQARYGLDIVLGYELNCRQLHDFKIPLLGRDKLKDFHTIVESHCLPSPI